MVNRGLIASPGRPPQGRATAAPNEKSAPPHVPGPEARGTTPLPVAGEMRYRRANDPGTPAAFFVS